MFSWMTKLTEKNNKKGFTLIELIVVIAILGILAAVLTPRIVGFTSSAKASATESNARQLYNAISLGVADDKIAPAASIADADTLAEVPGLATFLDEWPTDQTATPAAPLVVDITVASGAVTDITVYKADGTTKLAGK